MAPAPSSTPSPCGMTCEWRLGRCVFRCSAAWVSPCLDVACQAAAAGKKTRNKKTHDEFGDAAVNGPQHQTQVTLRRLILALRAAWGTAVRMEPTSHLGQSYNKQPDVDADSIGTRGRHYCGDVKVVCPLSCSGVRPNPDSRSGGVGDGDVKFAFLYIYLSFSALPSPCRWIEELTERRMEGGGQCSATCLARTSTTVFRSEVTPHRHTLARWAVV